jgi:hypothetical protein
MEKIREIQEKLNEIENLLRALPTVIDLPDAWSGVRTKLDTRLGELDTLYTELITPKEEPEGEEE